MEFLFCVANFVYTMYVCGKTNDTGCSGDIVEESDIIGRGDDGKFFICKQVLIKKVQFVRAYLFDHSKIIYVIFFLCI